jgi:hypothetical protein
MTQLDVYRTNEAMTSLMGEVWPPSLDLQSTTNLLHENIGFLLSPVNPK